MKIFNTMSREVEDFKPMGEVIGIYTCGPTVYWYAHIGNLRTYVNEDILKRVLIYNGYKVKHVMNITDVGHMTSDEDAGVDKIEKSAAREGKSPYEIARFYENKFKEHIKKLNIIEPDVWCRATEHVEDMIKLIKRLEEKGYTYDTGEVIYFDTSKFRDYGKLARLNLKELAPGARVELDPNKRNPYDFALWFKCVGKHANHIMRWDSPWGVGFPGWHIECSAMSMKYLGETFDIHCGGVDHIPVHHTNEIAQSECATGKKFVNYWVHSEFLLFGEEKMAKSAGNIYTLEDLENLGYDPLDFRYLCLTCHYRQQLKFTLSSLGAAREGRKRIINFIINLKNIKKEISNPEIDDLIEIYREKFEKHINNDLNIPQALSVIHEFIRTVNRMVGNNEIGKANAIKIVRFINEVDKVLGIIKEKEISKERIEEIERKIREREEARKNNDFEKSDKIREELRKEGIILEDTPEGTIWKFI
jgi:cysteinyl-tRNA synthetase